jgi:hypothetical protein
MMGGKSENGRQALEWVREGVERFESSGFQHALDEFWRENLRVLRMETAPAQLQPELEVLVQQVIDGSADQPGGRSAYQTTPEILAEITEEVHRMSRPEPDGYRLDAMWRIRAVIDSLRQIPKSLNRYIEKDLEVIFRDRFLMHAMAMDPHSARQIHEATGMSLTTLYKWRDHPEMAATGGQWNHKVNHGSHRCRLNAIEEKLIEQALSGPRAERGSIGSWCRLLCGRSRSGHAASGLKCVCQP